MNESYPCKRALACVVILMLMGGSCFLANLSLAENALTSYDQKVLAWAKVCRQEITENLEALLRAGKLKEAELFDTFYVPIAGTIPQKFHTRYDQKTDPILQPILDQCLAKDSKLVFVVVVDRNGYLPTHNSKYTRPLTGDMEYDAKWNRAKRLFNDRTGLAAAKNTQDFLIQRYNRDTGEHMIDLSLPIRVNQRHWGAVRVAYQP